MIKQLIQNRKKKYSDDEKKKIANEAYIYSNNSAIARKYGVSESAIREWKAKFPMKKEDENNQNG